MNNRLNMRVTSGTLLKYALPTILSALFTNVYSLVDELFVSNFLGTDALSAINISAPFLAIALAVGTMLAMGGSALVAKELGEKREEKARGNFSAILCLALVISLFFCALGIIFRSPVLHAMGADDALYPLCEQYAVPIFAIMPFAMTGIIIQIFFGVAGHPGLGFALSFAGGITNVVLDYLFIGVLGFGISGAAWATGIGYSLQAVAGLIWFAVKRNEPLYLVKPVFDTGELLKACGNGMSEMIGMLAVSVTMITMNAILMKVSGADGVAAAAVVMSTQSILSAVFTGYLEGIAPVISYNYGKGDRDNLKKLYSVALITIGIMSAVSFVLSFPAARPIAMMYASRSEKVMEMAVLGIRMFSAGFLMMGVNLFASSLFTALNDGKTSAILSVFRTFVFLMVPLLTLPMLFGINGVWASLAVCEGLSLIMSVYYFRKNKPVYHYA